MRGRVLGVRAGLLGAALCSLSVAQAAQPPSRALSQRPAVDSTAQRALAARIRELGRTFPGLVGIAVRNIDERAELMASWNLPGGAMWKKTLISPTDVDKLVKPQANGEKPVIGKIRYARLLPHIQQPDGKPQVVPDTDPRPALQPQLAGFDEVPPADNSDLLS